MTEINSKNQWYIGILEILLNVFLFNLFLLFGFFNNINFNVAIGWLESKIVYNLPYTQSTNTFITDEMFRLPFLNGLIFLFLINSILILFFHKNVIELVFNLPFKNNKLVGLFREFIKYLILFVCVLLIRDGSSQLVLILRLVGIYTPVLLALSDLCIRISSKNSTSLFNYLLKINYNK